MINPNGLRAPLRGDVVLGSLWSWKGRIASQRASGGASGAWIGQDRERKGLCPFEESHPAIRFQYIRRQMGKASPKIFSQNQIPDSGWASPIFPPAQFLEVPCNTVITTILQPHNMGNRADSWYDEQP